MSDTDATPDFRGRGLKAWLGRLFLGITGWKIRGGYPATDKAVVVAYPHTTNWDLPFSLAICWVVGVRFRWIGKHTLFRWPIGWFMRALGGLAVDRRTSHNAVQAIAELIRQQSKVLLLIPPEGTRSRARRWKTGFYWIAVAAGVPILLGFLDYSERIGGFATLLEPCGDIRADVDRIRQFYSGVRGKFPELQGEITIAEDEADEAPAGANDPTSTPS